MRPVKIYNFTSLKQREAKLYNVGGYNFAGGISIDFLKITAPITFVVYLLLSVIGSFFGVSGLPSDSFSLKYCIFTAGISFMIAYGLWRIEIGGYRLYMYLIAYFRPKYVYTSEFKPQKVEFIDIKINANITSLL